MYRLNKYRNPALFQGKGKKPPYFEGWYIKDMGTWYKIYDDNNIVLEFYVNNYIITKEAKSFKAHDVVKYQIPLPQTINDFINDMWDCKTCQRG